jgi:hypothetical protein
MSGGSPTTHADPARARISYGKLGPSHGKPREARFPTGPSPLPTENPPPSASGWKTVGAVFHSVSSIWGQQQRNTDLGHELPLGIVQRHSGTTNSLSIRYFCLTPAWQALRLTMPGMALIHLDPCPVVISVFANHSVRFADLALRMVNRP